MESVFGKFKHAEKILSPLQDTNSNLLYFFKYP